MDRLFSYHIDNKSLKPIIVKRSLKIYIENFDPDKSYLLESEVKPYLEMSDAKAQAIGEEMKTGNYSAFDQLDVLFAGSIERSRKIRADLQGTVSRSDVNFPALSSHSNYSRTKKELIGRLQHKMAKYLSYQEKKAPIHTLERRRKVFELMDKKMARLENPYLAQSSLGETLSSSTIESRFSLRILKAFAKSLDAHTSFFSAEEAGEMRLNLEKQFEGFGVVLSEGIDGVIISEVIPGSPAEKSGQVKQNDLLVEIDGNSLNGMPFETVLDLMKKRESPDLVLGLERVSSKNGSAEKDFTRVKLTRGPIVMNGDRISSSYEPYGNGIIAKITNKSFYENGNGINSEKDIRKAIKELRKHGEIKGLVLDLRNNAGGFLSQAVKVAGLFVSSGVIVISKYGKKDVHYLRTIDPRTFYKGPMVVLTSKLSASAAEIVAQALQDYGVALVVGDERTFGKGSIQYQTVTDSRADLFFKVTVGKYYTVSGRTTQVNGVIADIVVPTQYAPFNIGEKFLEYPLASDKVNPAYKDSLVGMDERMKAWFTLNYLPHLQKKVSTYRNMLPELKQNSHKRIKRNPDYQAFLKNQDQIRARLAGDASAKVDLQANFGIEDIQMAETINVLKDMIYMEAKSRRVSEQNTSALQTELKKAS